MSCCSFADFVVGFAFGILSLLWFVIAYFCCFLFDLIAGLAKSFFYLFICWSKTLLAAAKIDAILATCFFILYFDLSFFIKSLRTLLFAAFIIDH
jgi:hypothetical protein